MGNLPSIYFFLPAFSVLLGMPNRRVVQGAKGGGEVSDKIFHLGQYIVFTGVILLIISILIDIIDRMI